MIDKKEGIIVELRDYYNANKEPIGETYPSNIEPTGDKYMLIVVIFIQNSKGEYLIQKATKRKGGKWGTTSGHPVAGENSIKGMNREIREELGIDIPIEKYKFVNTFIGHNKIVDLYYLMEDIDILKLSLQPEEVEKVKWVTKEEIDTLIKDNDFEKTHTKLFADLQKWMNND